LGLRIERMEVSHAEDLDTAFRAAMNRRVEGIIVVNTALVSGQSGRIINLAGQNASAHYVYICLLCYGWWAYELFG